MYNLLHCFVVVFFGLLEATFVHLFVFVFSFVLFEVV